MTTELEMRSTWVPEPVMHALTRRGLNYTRAVTVYHCVWVNYGQALVGVFGDGANGSYEWFIWSEDEGKLRTSDAGYGNDCAALCCGLVESGASMANGDHDLLLSWKREDR